MPLVADRVRNRLGQLSRRLGCTGWLDGAFSAGGLMMVPVLQAESVGFAGRISKPLCRCDLRWPAAKRGPPASVPSTRNWRFSLASRRAVRRNARFDRAARAEGDCYVTGLALVICVLAFRRGIAGGIAAFLKKKQ